MLLVNLHGAYRSPIWYIRYDSETFLHNLYAAVSLTFSGLSYYICQGQKVHVLVEVCLFVDLFIIS